MSRLGFDRRNGFIYEGRDDPRYPVWPSPVVSQATLIESPADFSKLPAQFDANPFAWLFREDFFDPVTRIRRGRLFQSAGSASWEFMPVEVHPAAHSDRGAMLPDGRVRKEIAVYHRCSELTNKQNRGLGYQLALGTREVHTLWKVLQIESTVNDDVLVTLRAESAFDIIPTLDKSAIPSNALPSVERAITRVLDAAYKELPSSVVDQCRNAATVIASRWYAHIANQETAGTQDLGHWVKAVRAHPYVRNAVADALETIALLHVRNKANEVERLHLRPVVSEDSEYALHALGFILRDIGWAK